MKYTVITGASSGIGYESALAFAKKGGNLILVARRKDRLESLKSLINELYKDLDVVLTVSDLSNPKQAYDLYNSLKSYEIETWINNAGLGDSSQVIQENLDKIENMLKVNIESLTILSTLYAKDYADYEGAQLINVSSAMGYMVALGSVVYSATKYYVSAFTEGLANELINNKISVKVLAPAVTETEFINKSLNVTEFDYKAGVSNYHSAKEMAEFMITLYESDKVIGIVNEKYEFNLLDGIYPILRGL
ncbi:SDR family NAD(P)-dependent oxidoreductase [Priestia aryabhattai]|uniref:SDR family NAD(P)-dependent oxidoreductase n=1 Tax=Priestia aryabhattai TaxID=412384 RepID=UPI001ADC8870|nr:SDR family NAD(P)-dependent oxidoreductase [Priestia aryabhattai]QTL52249.1 SDR family NAD(P)-dependent oxidoreductase [Priestia aryabhattai]